MTPADFERLRSWALAIAATLLGDVKHRDEGDERRFLGQGGLTINRLTGAWYSHAINRGGHSPIGLIQLLGKYQPNDAVAWGEAWLSNHPGTGDCVGTEPEDDCSPARRTEAERIPGHLIDVSGTRGEIYLKSRGIAPPYPSCVHFLPDARIGEGALVGVLTSHARVVGYQLGYLTPDGQKSLVEPKRRRFMLEQAPDAAFEISGPGDAIFVCEGLEDAATVAALGRHARVIGLPGIGTMKHLRFESGTSITVVRDGDAPGSAADIALRAGLDNLLLQRVAVDVTATPLGQDANAILQDGGSAALAELLDNAFPAELSRDGIIRHLATLDPVNYETHRKKQAAKLGLRVSILDELVEQKRRETRSGTRVEEDDAAEDAEPGLLDKDIVLADVLDGIVTELTRYVVAPETTLATLALWAAHTHLVHHDTIRLSVSPRLAIQAPDAGCGKTITLEAIGCLVPKPRHAASVTASSVFRMLASDKPTFLIDEADRLLKHGQHNQELMAVMNASHRRLTAYVHRSRALPDGSVVPESFHVWGAMALASIGELPRTQQSRSVVVNLDKALARDIPEHLEDGTSKELTDLYCELLTWAHDLKELPRPKLPELLTKQAGRVADNWRLLLAIAKLASGRWPELALNAMKAALDSEHRLSLTQRLLLSIHAVFHPEFVIDLNTGKEVAASNPCERLNTSDLLQSLLNDEAEEWGTANRGRAITEYWLRDHLRGMLDPPKSQQWWSDQNKSKRHRGYLRIQFEKAWQTHLAGVETSPPEPLPSETSAPSAPSEQPVENKEEFKEPSAPACDPIRSDDSDVPDEQPSSGADGADTGADTHKNNEAKSNTYSDGADGADKPRGKAPRRKKPSPNGQDPDRHCAHCGEPLTGHHAQRYCTLDCRRAAHDQKHGPQITLLDGAIKDAAAEHPNWSVARLAKHLGQPRSHVREVLGK